MVYVIQLASRIRAFRPDPARKLSANLYDIHHCCVYSEKLLMVDRGTVRNMWSFYSKNKFEELVHLVGFVMRRKVTLGLLARTAVPPLCSQSHSKIENKLIKCLICCAFKAQKNRGSSVGITMKLRSAQSGEFDSRQGHEIFVFCKSSIPTVVPTQTSIQRYRVSFPGAKVTAYL